MLARWTLQLLSPTVSAGVVCWYDQGSQDYRVDKVCMKCMYVYMYVHIFGYVGR
jgi:hypothetical protein